MASPMRFVMIGGFLGAGKTTTIARLAATYQSRGQKVGIVTNDQAADLVDTHALRRQGFDVGEVAGACFCCNFNELTETVAALEKENRPDVVLAEPVGSCTDLVATVMQPLMRLFGEKFSVAPYGVILKPSHGRRILGGKKLLGGKKRAGFSPKAAYIFKKQLEEADFLIINRIDELEPEEVQELHQLLEEETPGIPKLRLSAKTGNGFEALVEMLDKQGIFGQRILELDYEIYAEGEAELGWLNSSLRVTSDVPYSLDDVLLGIVSRLKSKLADADAETAHLKAIGLWEGFHGVANLVSSDSPAELSLPSSCETKTADIVVNARVATSPDFLREQVEAAVRETCDSVGATPEFRQTQSFRPGRPVPTHRYSQAYDGK
jgi:Ni2+-binding GTPase involved in maturation of urease and hydrogenase